MIAELGLRFQPSADADLEAHAARLALLTVDVSHLPVEPLQEAARRWSATKPYLPKASELIELAREAAQPKGPIRRRGLEWYQDRADAANRELSGEGRDDIRWTATPNGCQLIDAKELAAMAERARDPASAAYVPGMRKAA